MIHWPITPVEDQIFVHGSRLWVYKDCAWISTCCPNSIRCNIRTTGIIIGITFENGPGLLDYPITLLFPMSYMGEDEWVFDTGSALYRISYNGTAWVFSSLTDSCTTILAELISESLINEPIGSWTVVYGMNFSVDSICGTVDVISDCVEYYSCENPTIFVPVVEDGDGILGTPSAYAITTLEDCVTSTLALNYI